MSNKKIKRKLDTVLKEVREQNRLLHAICDELGISVRLGGVRLASLDNMLKELYPPSIPTKMTFAPVSEERKELDREARIARAEEIASRMLPYEHDERDVIAPPPIEAKVRIPPNMELGW